MLSRRNITTIFIACFATAYMPCASATLAQNLPGSAPFLPAKANDHISTTADQAGTVPNETLNLHDAVFLALKHNPDIITGLNTRQVERFDLLTAEQKLEPSLTLTNSLGMSKSDNGPDSKNTIRQASIGPNMSWTLPTGTAISAGYTYNPSKQTGTSQYVTSSNGYNISVTQPLLKGFGFAANLTDYRNAVDTQKIDTLNLQKTVQTTIKTIATSYYAVVQAEQSFDIAKSSLKQSKQTLFARQKRFEAGQVPQMDVIQAKLDLATQQQSFEAARITQSNAKATFLDALGLPESTTFDVSDKVAVSQIKTHFSDAMKKALSNNIDLKIAEIKSRQEKRNIQKDANDRLWQLDLVLKHSKSTMATDYPSSSTSTSTTTLTRNNSASLTLTIPLDRVTIDQKALQAAVDLQNQEVTTANQKRTIRNNIRAAVENLHAKWQALNIAKERYGLSGRNMQATKIKYQYGKIDAFSYGQQYESLIQSQNALVTARISYLTEVIDYQILMGTLLHNWNVQIEATQHAKT